MNIGRSSALARIVSLTNEGEEAALVVCGERGSGRTHLLESARARVTGRAILVRINAAETGYPLSGLSAVLANIGDPRLAQFSGRFALVSSRPDDLFAAADQLLTLLRGVTLDPTAIFIDDADLMDAESLSIIGYVSTRLSSTRLSLVLTVQQTEGDVGGSDAGASSSALSGVPTVTLAPLDLAETAELITANAREPLDESTRQIIADYAEGSPLAVVEIAHGLASLAAAAGTPFVLPFRLSALTHRLAAQAAATVGSETLYLLQQISAAPLTSLDLIRRRPAESDALDELVARHLVTVDSTYARVATTVIRSGTYWSMPSSLRRSIHRDLSERTRALDPALSAWHESWATARSSLAGTLIGAATSFAARGEKRAAVELAERGLVTKSARDSIVTELAGLASALLDRGYLVLALRYCQVALSLKTTPADELSLQSVKVRAEFLLDERIAPNEVEARLSGSTPALEAASDRLLLSAAAVHAERGETAEARELASRLTLPSGSDASGDPLYWPRALVRSLTGALEPLTDARSTPPELTTLSVSAQVIAGRALSFAEHHSEARKTFVGVLVRATDADRTTSDIARVFAAENDMRSGYLQHALTFIDGLPHDSEVLHFRRSLLLGWAAALRGHDAEATALFAACADRLARERNPVLAARFYSAQGTFDLMRGDIDASLEHFHRVRSITKNLTLALHARHNVDLIEATVLSGAHREAHALLLEFDELRAQLPSHWSSLAAARARALLADDDRAIASFDQAISSYQPDDSPYELGRVLLAYATRLDHLSLADQANAARATAHQVFTSLGATGWVQASIRPPRLAEPPPKPSGLTANLTPGEVDVIRMLERGYRNKEIAARLFVSLRTVEVRLTQIYRKTGARSRSHLLALLSHSESSSDAVSGSSAMRTQIGGPA